MAITRKTASSVTLGGLARQLVEDGLIESEKALELQRGAQRDGESFVARVVATGREREQQRHLRCPHLAV